MVLSSAIVGDHNRRIADIVSIWSQTIADLIAICDLRSYGNQPLEPRELVYDKRDIVWNNVSEKLYSFGILRNLVKDNKYIELVFRSWIVTARKEDKVTRNISENLPLITFTLNPRLCLEMSPIAKAWHSYLPTFWLSSASVTFLKCKVA